MEKRAESIALQLAGKRTGYVPQAFGFGPPAGGPPGGGFGPGNQLAKPLLDTMDGNRDAKVSEAEFNASTKKFFREWDRNKDGVLDQQEIADGLQKLVPPPKKGGFPGGPGGFGGGPFGPPGGEQPAPRPRPKGL